MTKTNADVSRAASSAVDAASAGLERYFVTMQERVISLLGEDRASFTKVLEEVQTMLAAVAHEQHETRAEGKRDRGELLAGVHGVAQDISVVVASVQEATARLGKLETRMAESEKDRADLRTRLDLFEAKVAQDIQIRLARIEDVLAERPVARAREHQAILNAIVHSHADPLHADGHDGP